MRLLEIRRYSSEKREEWDAFVRASRNATFLFERGYMDYHSSRFKDSSVMAYRKGKLRAILPANITADGVLHSHQGLTYGGWILPQGHVDGAELLEIFEEAIALWKTEGISALDYKPLPFIYASDGAQEDLYALFRLGAIQAGCGLSIAVDLRNGLRLGTMQRRHLKGAGNRNLRIEENEDTEIFMRMLEECLEERHGVRPVHTLEELTKLRGRFPGNIRIFTIYSDNGKRPDAGVCIYDTGRVAHAQYIATTQRGRELNLLTPLFVDLMGRVFATRDWFDFGTSNEDHGRILNKGLLRQKFSYGGSGIVYPQYYLRFNSDERRSQE